MSRQTNSLQSIWRKVYWHWWFIFGFLYLRVYGKEIVPVGQDGHVTQKPYHPLIRITGYLSLFLWTLGMILPYRWSQGFFY